MRVLYVFKCSRYGSETWQPKVRSEKEVRMKWTKADCQIGSRSIWAGRTDLLKCKERVRCGCCGKKTFSKDFDWLAPRASACLPIPALCSLSYGDRSCASQSCVALITETKRLSIMRLLSSHHCNCLCWIFLWSAYGEIRVTSVLRIYLSSAQMDPSINLSQLRLCLLWLFLCACLPYLTSEGAPLVEIGSSAFTLHQPNRASAQLVVIQSSQLLLGSQPTSQRPAGMSLFARVRNQMLHPQINRREPCA